MENFPRKNFRNLLFLKMHQLKQKICEIFERLQMATLYLEDGMSNSQR